MTEENEVVIGIAIHPCPKCQRLFCICEGCIYCGLPIEANEEYRLVEDPEGELEGFHPIHEACFQETWREFEELQ